ncbi:hypothetical protein Catovirus_1_299 [Catovirus CTV1]|uniref:Uncharacterized protein n=1 Tax=Catovirus CTV1 TaxID=1977631 RepID=A0A1V0S971_9VIRU|nr:hypothetical protein Catovirus_1_299 [Catovirus CTV1]
MDDDYTYYIDYVMEIFECIMDENVKSVLNDYVNDISALIKKNEESFKEIRFEQIAKKEDDKFSLLYYEGVYNLHNKMYEKCFLCFLDLYLIYDCDEPLFNHILKEYARMGGIIRGIRRIYVFKNIFSECRRILESTLIESYSDEKKFIKMIRLTKKMDFGNILLDLYLKNARNSILKF